MSRRNNVTIAVVTGGLTRNEAVKERERSCVSTAAGRDGVERFVADFDVSQDDEQDEGMNLVKYYFFVEIFEEPSLWEASACS